MNPPQTYCILIKHTLATKHSRAICGCYSAWFCPVIFFFQTPLKSQLRYLQWFAGVISLPGCILARSKTLTGTAWLGTTTRVPFLLLTSCYLRDGPDHLLHPGSTVHLRQTLLLLDFVTSFRASPFHLLATSQIALVSFFDTKICCALQDLLVISPSGSYTRIPKL
ncbi:hypothetical protein GGS26DRAFT_544251 [Hypomontagnella submonticulosa]|nr:hypothetical protein GGS26DRAFT_544251 [Hypomontagnella submonticulosa]